MNFKNFEEQLKQKYLLTINSLENVKGIVEFQIQQLKNAVEEIEENQDLRLVVENTTGSPIFIGNYRIGDFVPKRTLLKSVPFMEIKHLYEKGALRDVDATEIKENKNKQTSSTKPIAQGSNATSIVNSIFDKNGQLAVELDIAGVKDIEEKRKTSTKNEYDKNK